jgi:carbon monoxide dehydrogenase subunit G
MEIAGEFVFDAPQAGVWEVLRDPKALAVIVPMAMNMKQVADNQYTGTLFFKVGAVAGAFHGKIELTNLQAPDSYDIEVRGSSPVGQAHIKGRMRLESLGDQTTMFYEGDINFGGRIASVGSRLLDVSVRTIMEQSFKTLDRYLTIKHKKP